MGSNFLDFSGEKGQLVDAKGQALTPELVQEALNKALNGHFHRPDFKWERIGYNRGASGIVYMIRQAGGTGWMVVRRHAGEWHFIGVDKQYVLQDDGWFLIENGAFFRLRDPWLEKALEAMELDMDQYLNELITVNE